MAFAVSTPIIYYNTDLVEQAGGDPGDLPTDWDGVLKLAQDINALGADKVGIYHSWAITGNWMWQALVFSHGGSMTTADESAVAFTDENGQRAMATFARILDEGKMPDLSHEAARQTFFAGNMGIWTESTSLLRVADENVGGKFNWKTGPFPLAGPNPRLPTGGNAALMFAKDPAQQAAAWEFMKFITGPVGATIMVKGTGYAPPNSTPADDPALLKPFYDEHPNHLTALRQAPYMTPWYAFTGANNLKIIDVIKDHLQSVANRSVAPADGLQAMAEEVKGLMP
jgi:multiple sugar transport system substrate-binding protein